MIYSIINIGLVDSIVFDNGAKVVYTYAMNGEKLRVRHHAALPSVVRPLHAPVEGGIFPGTPVSFILYDEESYYGGDVVKKSSVGNRNVYTVPSYRYYFGGGYMEWEDIDAMVGAQIVMNPDFYYYTKDHLGNVRSVVKADSNGPTEVQQTHYYPFGGIIADLSTGRDVQNRLYNGKELDTSNNLWWYDYGARQYNPVTARWDRMDPLCEKYYSVSPYAYCINNPINAIDPDGNLTIFINGFYPGINNPKEKYWDEELIKNARQRFENEKTIFYDGSLGGIRGLIDLFFNNSLVEDNRERCGYSQGVKDVERIISSLKRDKNGNIIEAIHIISHSMGGAYAKGVALAIVQYAMNNPNLCEGLRIAEYDFAPFEPIQQKSIPGVDNYQYSHTDDIVAGAQKIQGSTTETFNWSGLKRSFSAHNNSSFAGIVCQLPEGRYVFRNGQFIKVE